MNMNASKLNNVQFIKASLNLHNAVPIEEESKVNLAKTNLELIKYGYLVPLNISKEAKSVLISEAITLNSSFYKTWKDVTSKTREELFLDQIFHYIAVHLKAELREVMDVPLLIPNDNPNEQRTIPLRIIKGYTVDEIKDRTRKMVYQKIALKESTIGSIFDILNPEDVELSKIQNRDSKTYIYVNIGFKPKDPMELFRCAIYDITKELIIIKNKEMYEKIEKGQSGHVVKWLNGNEESLATLFNRYNKIFMSMKKHEAAKPYVNKISHLSKRLHVPLKLAPITPTTGFEIVRHLKYILENKQPKVYQVRNGKMWCTRDRVNDISNSVSKLKALLPTTFIQSPNTRLTLPTSEKNFAGAFPIGTRFSGTPLTIGIHWRNQGGHRIDLDLSAVDMNGKIGWDSVFYSNAKNVVFSGDVTDAPNGANEYLFFEDVTVPKIVMVNKYKTDHEGKLDMNIIIASGSSSPSKDTIIDERDIIATISTDCDEKQKILGVVYPGPEFVLIDKCTGAKLKTGAANEDSQIMMDVFTNRYLYMDEYSLAISEGDVSTVNLSNKSISKQAMLSIFN